MAMGNMCGGNAPGKGFGKCAGGKAGFGNDSNYGNRGNDIGHDRSGMGNIGIGMGNIGKGMGKDGNGMWNNGNGMWNNCNGNGHDARRSSFGSDAHPQEADRSPPPQSFGNDSYHRQQSSSDVDNDGESQDAEVKVLVEIPSEARCLRL